MTRLQRMPREGRSRKHTPLKSAWREQRREEKRDEEKRRTKRQQAPLGKEVTFRRQKH